MRPQSISCAQCGAMKAVPERGPLPEYCSASCRSKRAYAKAREDGRYGAWLTERRRRTQGRQEASVSPCAFCGSPMVNPNGRRKQCGKPECKRAFNAERMREWQRTYKAEHGQWYRQERYAEQQREYERRRRAEQGSSRKRYPAAAAAGDARRRMRMEQARTAETFAPLDVHTRDQWTCQLCQRPIDPQVAWPDPMSASVDHVVPLAKGGLHSMTNVQSAHLGCNSSKGDRLAGEAQSATPAIKS